MPIRGKGTEKFELKKKEIDPTINSKPADLFLHLYGNWLFEFILNSTQAYLQEHPDLINPSYPITLENIKCYFGYLILLTNFKTKHDCYRDYLKKSPDLLRALLEDNTLMPFKLPSNDSLQKMSKSKFEYFSKVLDLGQNRKTPKLDKNGENIVKSNGEICEVYDLAHKFGYCENQINKISQTYKTPKNMVVSLDETLRVSYSSWDQLRTFMPGKKPKVWAKKFLSG